MSIYSKHTKRTGVIHWRREMEQTTDGKKFFPFIYMYNVFMYRKPGAQKKNWNKYLWLMGVILTQRTFKQTDSGPRIITKEDEKRVNGKKERKNEIEKRLNGKYVHRHYRNHHDSHNAGTHTRTPHYSVTHSSRHLRKKGLIWAFLLSFVLCIKHTANGDKKISVWSNWAMDGRNAEYLIRFVY